MTEAVETLLALIDTPNDFLEEFMAQVDGEDLSGYNLENAADDNSHIDNLYVHTVHEVGGYEGGGESVERVYEFVLDPELDSSGSIVEDTGRPILYVKQTGYYNSHDGIEWDNKYTRVYPRPVTVTQYSEEPRANPAE